jgi:electron transport complex protein RnfB
MLSAVLSLTAVGACLGLILGVAARRFHVEADAKVAELEAILPGNQCGQCGYPGCSPAAEALAKGEAPVTLCPPGGRTVAAALADLLGVSADLSAMGEAVPMLAAVREEICIGCTKCFKTCPTDAIHGAAKHIHSVLQESCTGCAKCVEACPTEALSLVPVPTTVGTWAWHKPAHA